MTQRWEGPGVCLLPLRSLRGGVGDSSPERSPVEPGEPAVLLQAGIAATAAAATLLLLLLLLLWLWLPHPQAVRRRWRQQRLDERTRCHRRCAAIAAATAAPTSAALPGPRGQRPRRWPRWPLRTP